MVIYINRLSSDPSSALKHIRHLSQIHQPIVKSVESWEDPFSHQENLNVMLWRSNAIRWHFLHLRDVGVCCWNLRAMKFIVFLGFFSKGITNVYIITYISSIFYSQGRYILQNSPEQQSPCFFYKIHLKKSPACFYPEFN